MRPGCAGPPATTFCERHFSVREAVTPVAAGRERGVTLGQRCAALCSLARRPMIGIKQAARRWRNCDNSLHLGAQARGQFRRQGCPSMALTAPPVGCLRSRGALMRAPDAMARSNLRPDEPDQPHRLFGPDGPAPAGRNGCSNPAGIDPERSRATRVVNPQRLRSVRAPPPSCCRRLPTHIPCTGVAPAFPEPAFCVPRGGGPR